MAEYEPQRIHRQTIHDIIEAVNVCSELQRLDGEQPDTFIPWSPFDDESYDDLLYGEHRKTLQDYYTEYGPSDTTAELKDLPETERDNFEDQIRNAIYTVMHLHNMISETLVSEPGTRQVNQRALKEMLQAFAARYPDDGYFSNPDEILFGDIRDFMDDYRSEMVGAYVSDTDSPGARFQEYERAETILIEESRGAFIASLRQLKEQGLIDDEQLERAQQIATDIPIVATDPLSEVMYHRTDEEERAFGYYLIPDRTIFINHALIRHAVDSSFADTDAVKRDQIFERTVASTVFHELVHSISNTWYSSLTQETYDCFGEKEIATTSYDVKRLFPRFIDEALTELIAHDLFTSAYGSEPEDYYAYATERQIVQTMIEKFDWSSSGSNDDTPDTVLHRLKRAFLDSPSGLTDTKRPLDTYIAWAKSLQVANTPGIIQRMAAIDEQFGVRTLHRVITSDAFSPAEDTLRFEGMLTARMLKALRFSASRPRRNQDLDMAGIPPSFVKNYERQQARRERAQKALRLYGAVQPWIKASIELQYPAPGEVKEEFLHTLIVDSELRTLVPRLHNIIQAYRDTAQK